MQKIASIIQNLKDEASLVQPMITRLRHELAATEAIVGRINRRIVWLECWYRYGDILEILPYRSDGKVEQYVATHPSAKGRKLKKDGTLYSQTMYMSGTSSWGGGGPPDRASIVGRYEGTDLPRPDKAAQFGLDNRETDNTPE